MRTLLRGETMETQEALLERQRDGAYGRPPRRAESIRAGPVTVSKSLLKGRNSQFSGLAPNMDRPVQLSSFANSFLPIHMLPIMPPRGGFSSVTTRTAAIDASGTKIVTCSQPRVGCLQIRYFKNWDASVSLISKIEGGYTVPMQVPASWGCSTSSFDALSAGSMSLASFSAQLEDANATRTWFLRVLGLVFTWLTVSTWPSVFVDEDKDLFSAYFRLSCAARPIAAAADIVGDCLAYIPCVGEFMEDLLEGMVDTLLCMVSCGVGCSCGLLVIGIVWLFMRPLIGGGLLLVCVVLGICAFAVAHQHKANKDISDQSFLSTARSVRARKAGSRIPDQHTSETWTTKEESLPSWPRCRAPSAQCVSAWPCSHAHSSSSGTTRRATCVFTRTSCMHLNELRS
eukprot:s227_g15.t1